MRLRVAAALVAAILLWAAPSLAQVRTGSGGTLIVPQATEAVTASLTASAACSAAPGSGSTRLDVGGYASAAIQVTGTWSGTLSFEVSADGDGTTYQTVSATPSNSTTTTTSTTGNGIWGVSVTGDHYLCVRFSSYSSGTAVVTMRPALAGGGSGGGGGGGGSAPSGTIGAAVPSTASPVAVKDNAGNLAYPQVDASGNLLVAVTGAGSGGTSSTDGSAYTAGTTAGTPAMGARDDTGTTACAEDKVCLARLNSNRALLVDLSATTANGTAVKVDGSAVTQPVSGTVTATLAAGSNASTTLQSAATANGAGTLMSVSGLGRVALTVNCASCAGGTNVVFEGTEDGTNFAQVFAYKMGGTNNTEFATNTSTAGVTMWTMPVAGLVSLRARINSYSSGTITVTGHATSANDVPPALVVNAPSGSSIPIALNAVNGGTTTAFNTGVVGTQTLRTTLATDVALPTGTNSIGQVTANAGTNLNTSALALDATVTGRFPAGSNPANGESNAVNVSRVGAFNYIFNGTTWDRWTGAVTNTAFGITQSGTNNDVDVASIAAGSNLIGKVGIDQTTPGTTNGVQVNAALPTGSNTIGAVNQGTAAGASGRWPMYLTDGTNTMPTGDTTARPIYTSDTNTLLGGNGENLLLRILQLLQQQGGTPRTATALRGTFNRAITSSGDALDVNVKYPAASYDPCSGPKKQNVAISQTTSTVILTKAAGRVYVCSIFVVGADAENLSLVEGTGSACGTSTAAIIGGTTANAGPNFAANGGFVAPPSNAWMAVSATPGNDICLLQSGTGRVAGNMTVAIQ